jgi:glc operon protein GlcG
MASQGHHAMRRRVRERNAGAENLVLQCGAQAFNTFAYGARGIIRGKRKMQTEDASAAGREILDERYRGGASMWQKAVAKILVAVLLAVAALASALAQAPSPYGPPINLENAKKAPALAEAAKNNWTMAVAIVDPAGNLVYFEKMDNTQLGSVNVAMDKARSAALFKRPTQAFQDRLAAGGDGLGVLRLQGAVPVAGGVPLLMDGKIAGAIGVSGATSAQDAQCAKAGADALK